MFEVNDIVRLRQKNLYWVQNGSHTLNSVLDMSSKLGDVELRARVLKVQYAPRWGNLLFLAVEGQNSPPNSALVALTRHCDRCM